MDRLFREKANQYEVQPAASAWEAISGEISTDKRALPLVWKVAAMIVVLLSAVLVIFKMQNPAIQGTVVADHPVQDTYQFVWSFSGEVHVPKANETLATTNRSVVPVTTIETEVFAVAASRQIRPILELERMEVALELPEIIRPGLYLEYQAKSSVKITYYASHSDPETETGKKSFGQFLAKAQEKLSPDVLLADIRTAKDDLFRNNRGD